MIPTNQYLNRHAFTLIEVSIVIAVIGLLIGSIVGGQSLYKGQILRSVGTEATRYMVGMNQFTLKYGYPPGDLPNATAIWGNATAGAAGANCSASAVSALGNGTSTCNGDGNGHISRFVTASVYIGEPWRAWQQLKNAGVISGTYSGRPHCFSGPSYPACNVHTDGTGYFYAGFSPMNNAVNTYLTPNVPKGPVKNSAFSWFGATRGNDATVLSSTGGWWSAWPFWYMYPGDYTNILAFGDEYIFPDSLGPALTAAEAFELDRKLDDAKPGTGNLRANGNSAWSAYPCTTLDITQPTASEYDVANQDVNCTLFFMRGFASNSANTL